MPVILAALSALMYGAADFTGGLATRRGSVTAVLVLSQFTGLVLAAAAGLVMGSAAPSLADVGWGVLGGVSGAAGLAALYTAIARTPVAVASPMAAVVGAVIPAALGFTAGERPSGLEWAGIALTLPAIVLLAAGPVRAGDRAAARRGAVLGAAAGVGFGLFFFGISHTAPASGLWPLVAARVVTIALVAGYLLARRKPLVPGGAGTGLVLLAGVLDMGANIAFLLASRLGMLTVAAVVTSLYPGPTVLLAVLVFRERLGAARIAGFALALAGVALIAA